MPASKAYIEDQLPATDFPRSGGRNGRCLVALTEQENELLIGGEQWHALCATVGDVIEVPPGELTPREWERVLADAQCEILVGAWAMPAIPDNFPLQMHPLRYVCSLVGGVRRHVPRRLIEQGLLVTNWGSSISRTVAESALMLILMASRRTAYWHETLHHEMGWRRFPEGANERSLFERRVGLHGFGRIARELVTLLRPFGVQIATYCPAVPDESLEVYGVQRAHSLESLFAENEVLVELAALTDETRSSVTEALLRSIPEDGIFVNVGRGPVVDEEALIRVARGGCLRIALDVFATEPLPKDSPLRSLNDVVLMPHQSGPTPDRMRDVGTFAVENLKRYRSGKPLKALIDSLLYDQMT